MNIGFTFTRTGSGFARIAQKQMALLDKAVRVTTFRVKANTKRRIMLPPKTGRIYHRGKGRVHQASAPGEAPATDYGYLVASVNAEFKRKLEGIISVSAEYAAGLEFGSARVEPRPFLKPATNEERERFNVACAKALRDGAR